MNNHDGPGARGEASFDGLRGNNTGLQVNIGPYQPGALLHEGIGRGGVGMGGDDHLVARIELAQLRGQFEGVRGRSHRKGPTTAVLKRQERMLELVAVTPLRQRRRLPHGFHDYADFVIGVIMGTAAERNAETRHAYMPLNTSMTFSRVRVSLNRSPSAFVSGFS